MHPHEMRTQPEPRGSGDLEARPAPPSLGHRGAEQTGTTSVTFVSVAVLPVADRGAMTATVETTEAMRIEEHHEVHEYGSPTAVPTVSSSDAGEAA
jgi:hypothetical protein